MSQLLVYEGEKRQKQRKERERKKNTQREREKRQKEREKIQKEREREREGKWREGGAAYVSHSFIFWSHFSHPEETMSQADFMAADSRMNKRIKVEEVSIAMRVTSDTLMTPIQPQDRGYGHSAGYYGHSNSRYAGGGR